VESAKSFEKGRWIMATPEEIAESKAANRAIIEAGKPLYAKLEKELRGKYPPNHIVIIDVASGAYIVERTEIEAIEAARKAFPAPCRGYVCRVDAQPLVEFGGCPG
jgi:hypothetical protein